MALWRCLERLDRDGPLCCHRLPLLRRHRQSLLEELHRAGERVDLLDFLLYTLKQHTERM